MSHKNIQELTLRLSSALDQNYNVIKLEEVLSVINTLESTAITKDQLETTRLAKYINQLRRRTTNEQLAKKAKCLLKKWREKLLASNDIKKTNVHNLSFKLTGHHSNNDKNTQADCLPNFQLNHGQNTYRRQTTESLLPTIDSDKFPKLSKSSSDYGKPSVSTDTLSYSVDNSNSEFGDEIMTVPQSYNNSNSINIKSEIDAPIVIDLHDTNSMDMSTSADVPPVSRDFSICSSTAIGQKMSSPNNRSSVSKRKIVSLEFEDTMASCTTNIVTTATPMQQRCSETSGGGQDTKTLNNLSISDILSLSNSSMGSEKQRYGDITKENTVNIKQNKSDLTFAGKFKKKCGNTTNCLTNSTNNKNVEPIGFNYFGNNEREPLDLVHQKFAPFASLMSNNSNDKTASNSRILNFDVSQEKYSKSATTAKIITPTTIALNENVSNRRGHKDNGLEYTVDMVSATDLKIPKKRGRKKGSKGVDAVIAKETSLSSEMLIRGSMGCKKVKTTKELYAEMKNRKLGLSPSPSACFNSDPSVHSPRTLEASSTNAIATSPKAINQCKIENMPLSHTHLAAEKERDTLESDCFTLTSEPSGDSALLLKHDVDNTCVNASSMLNDSNSVGFGIAPPVKSNVIVADNYYNTSIATIKEQLYEMLCKLPPTPNCQDIEIECQADVVPCTCRIIQISNTSGEIIDYENDTLKIGNSSYNNKLRGKHVDMMNSKRDETKIESGAIAVEDKKVDVIKQNPLVMKKVVPKSIFDVDFDEDNDPLPTIIADLKANQFKLDCNIVSSVANTNGVTLSEKATVRKDRVNNSSSCSTTNMSKMSPLTPAEELPLTTTTASISVSTLLLDSAPLEPLGVEIDHNCPAKLRFEIQTQQINEFHIKALHNFYIPNVNGNWNEAFVLESPAQYTATSSSLNFHNFIDKEKINGHNVVPKYGALIKESLIKNLSQLSWSQFQTCKLEDNLHEELKFFGVIHTEKYKKDVNYKESKENSLYNSKSNSVSRRSSKSPQLTNLTIENWTNSKCNDKWKNVYSKVINKNKSSMLYKHIKTIGRESENEIPQCFEYNIKKKKNNKKQKLPRNNGKHLAEDELHKEVERKDNHHNCRVSETFQINLNKVSSSPPHENDNQSDICCDKNNETTMAHCTRNGSTLDEALFDENDYKIHQVKQFQGRRKRRKKCQNQSYQKKRKIHKVLFFPDELCPTTNSDDYILNVNSNSNSSTSSINSSNYNNSNINSTNCNNRSYRHTSSSTSNSETEYNSSDNDEYAENSICTQNYMVVNNNSVKCCNSSQKLDNSNINTDNVESVNINDDHINTLKGCNKSLGSLNMINDVNVKTVSTTAPTTAITTSTATLTVTTEMPLSQQNSINYTKSYENINIINNENYKDNNDDDVKKEFNIGGDKFVHENNNAQLLSFNKIYKETKLPFGGNKDDDNSTVVCVNKGKEQQETTLVNNNYNRDNILPLPEYHTGWRQVNEDLNHCQHWQQFAEWHQVLQLRSYNNELLTVLPYTIIE